MNVNFFLVNSLLVSSFGFSLVHSVEAMILTIRGPDAMISVKFSLRYIMVHIYVRVDDSDRIGPGHIKT